jgi:hypothetical protein
MQGGGIRCNGDQTGLKTKEIRCLDEDLFTVVQKMIAARRDRVVGVADP